MLPLTLSLSRKTILITGAAGFIGAHLARHLLRTVPHVTLVGLDDLNDYYDPALKSARLSDIQREAASLPQSDWTFVKGSIADSACVEAVFAAYSPDVVVHLAAQAGVRYSVSCPEAYIEANIVGFFTLLEACRRHAVAHLVYASSSSVYGAAVHGPFSVGDPSDCPVSLYAATKKSNEVMAYAYASLYGIPATGLRFFTVYGPCGRPDMAYFSFAERLVAGESIEIFNYGNCRRDLTYVDDVTEGILRVMQHPPAGAPPTALYNIGGGHPETLLDLVTILQEELTAAGLLPSDYDGASRRILLPPQAGDVPLTFADAAPLERDFGFRPATPLREGLRRFVAWYRDYRKARGEA